MFPCSRQRTGFETSVLEPCVLVLRRTQRFCHGIIGVAVDDSARGRDAVWKQTIAKLEQSFIFGHWKVEKGNFCTQAAGGSMHVGQSASENRATWRCDRGEATRHEVSFWEPFSICHVRADPICWLAKAHRCCLSREHNFNGSNLFRVLQWWKYTSRQVCKHAYQTYKQQETATHTPTYTFSTNCLNTGSHEFNQVRKNDSTHHH